MEETELAADRLLRVAHNHNITQNRLVILSKLPSAARSSFRAKQQELGARLNLLS